MKRVEQTIEVLASALMTIPRDYPSELRRASYRKTLEGFARFVLSEKAAEDEKTIQRVKEDLAKVAEIAEAARTK